MWSNIVPFYPKVAVPHTWQDQKASMMQTHNISNPFWSKVRRLPKGDTINRRGSDIGRMFYLYLVFCHFYSSLTWIPILLSLMFIVTIVMTITIKTELFHNKTFQITEQLNIVPSYIIFKLLKEKDLQHCFRESKKEDKMLDALF